MMLPFALFLLGALSPDVTLYKAKSPVATTAQRFLTPTLVEPAILNPPGFRWPALAGAAGYDLEIFRPGAKLAYPGLKLNLFTPERPLDPGKWSWRTRVAGGEWSAAHEFVLADGLPSIPIPPMGQLLARLKEGGYPRVFLRRGNLEEWRAKMRGPRRQEWQALSAGLAQAARVDVADPPRMTGGRMGNAGNNRIYQDAVKRAERVAEAIQSLALSALLSGNKEHGQAARRLLLALAEWNPEGSTSRKDNDTAYRAVVRGLTRGYDWLHGAGLLSPDDRAVVERAMTVRGAQYVEWYRVAQVNTRWPTTSHANGGLPYFGEMATVFAGVLPEATEWLRFWVHVMAANYPAFGRTDGSWSEGGRYWHNTTDRHLFPVWGLSATLGLNLPAHPYFANTGYFKIYSNPPWDRMTVFGDAHNQPVGGADARVVGTLGTLLRNPDFAWYAEAIRGGKADEEITAAEFLTFDQPLLAELAKSSNVRRLPLARVFPDTGLAALRTDLTDKNADIEFLLRSNPFGSVSHAHADQGNFYLAAFGEPLLVPSGHYQGGPDVLYNSPHHIGWTGQSWAHNVPLVDGKGQASRTSAAAGQVEHFYHSPVADYVRVDVTNAYRAESADEAVRTILKFSPEMVQRIGKANVSSYRRAVLFLRPGTFVVFDNLESPTPSRLDWLLHSWNRFTIDEPGRAVAASSGPARASVRLVTGNVTGISQTGDYLFPVPKDYKTQWHLTARFAPERHHRIVSVIHAGRSGGEVPVSEATAGDGWTGASLLWRGGQATVVFADTAARLTVPGAVADAAVLASSGDWVYAADATRLEARGRVWEFSAPVDVLLTGEGLKVAGDGAN